MLASLFHRKPKDVRAKSLFMSINGYSLEVLPKKYLIIKKTDTLLFQIIIESIKDSKGTLLKGWIAINSKSVFGVSPGTIQDKIGLVSGVTTYRNRLTVLPSKLKDFCTRVVQEVTPDHKRQDCVDIAALYQSIMKEWDTVIKPWVDLEKQDKNIPILIFNGINEDLPDEVEEEESVAGSESSQEESDTDNDSSVEDGQGLEEEVEKTHLVIVNVEPLVIVNEHHLVVFGVHFSNEHMAGFGPLLDQLILLARNKGVDQIERLSSGECLLKPLGYIVGKKYKDPDSFIKSLKDIEVDQLLKKGVIVLTNRKNEVQVRREEGKRYKMFVSFTNFIVHFVCKGIIRSPLASLIHDSLLAAGLIVKTGSDYVEAVVAEARVANANASDAAQALNNEIKNEVETTFPQLTLQADQMVGSFLYIAHVGIGRFKCGKSDDLKNRNGQNGSVFEQFDLVKIVRCFNATRAEKIWFAHPKMKEGKVANLMINGVTQREVYTLCEGFNLDDMYALAIEAMDQANNELLLQHINPEVAKMEIEHTTRRLEIECNTNTIIEQERSKQEEERSKQTELKNRRISMVLEHPKMNDVAADKLVSLMEKLAI